MGTNIPFRTLADYIASVNKTEAEKVSWQVIQANYDYVSRNGMRIPCHNRATQLYYQRKEQVEDTLNKK